MDSSTPPKKSAAFTAWLEDVWWLKFWTAVADSDNWLLFTDGLYSHNPDAGADSVWLVCDGKTIIGQGKFECRKALSFDAKMMALA